ncbi:Gag-Pol polyprotein [Nosema granulosis]|uniref:Gag-Pol polyprotein n=1 Tax=Nosema granulosis TaxID=83296 RepID=A0A9P6KXZ7_9MICR|nr:Gag-Pol polyprotein [Nosema granulosis]
MKVFEEYHEVSAHGSPNTMKFMISQRYKWRNMYADIDNFCKRCTTCMRDGGELVNTKNKVIKADYPNQLWEVDLMGKIHEKEGGKYIFVAIDHFTKWVETKVLESKSANNIGQAVEELIILKHGIPERILSDNGLEFDNKIVAEIAKKYSLKWKFESPYHHQTTGAVERVNQTLRTRLRRITDFGRLSWCSLLPRATLAYNLSFNRAIGTSPFIFKHGVQKEIGVDKILGGLPRRHSMQDIIDHRNRNFETYEKSMVKGKRSIQRNLRIGDKVLIFRDLVGDKMAEKWWRGYVITDFIGDDAYMVRQVDGNSLLRVNKRHIKKDTFFSG